MKKLALFLIFLIIPFFLFVPKTHAYNPEWTVASITYGEDPWGINGFQIYGSNWCGRADLRTSYGASYGGYHINSSSFCVNDTGLDFQNQTIPDGTFYVAVFTGQGGDIEHDSNFFTVQNGVLIDNNAAPVTKPTPNPESQVAKLNVYGYQDNNELITTLGPNFCDPIGWDVYNTNNQIVTHISNCGGNGELLVIRDPLPDGTFYVFGYDFVATRNNVIIYEDFYSNTFQIVNGQFYRPNVAPQINSLSPATVGMGDTFSANGSFIDSDSTSWTATINYGDGSGIQPLTLSGKNFSLSHVYNNAGTFPVTVSVTDTQGATATKSTTVTVIRRIKSLSPAKVWVGLPDFFGAGAKFDLLAEVYKDATKISSGQLNSVDPGLGFGGFSGAKLNTIPFSAFSPVDFPQGSSLSIKVYARTACTGSSNPLGTARLWFNDSQANSSFGANIGITANTYYLLNNSLLGTIGAGPKKTAEVKGGSNCSLFKPFGTWTVAP